MDRKGKNAASGGNLDPPECSRQSHPTTLAALMGYLSFVYHTDAYKDHQIPPHPELKRILFSPEGFQWTRNCAKDLEKLERASGIAYQQVEFLFRTSCIKSSLGRDSIGRCPSGCRRFNFCTCVPKEARLQLEPSHEPEFAVMDSDFEGPSYAESEYLRIIEHDYAQLGEYALSRQELHGLSYAESEFYRIIEHDHAQLGPIESSSLGRDVSDSLWQFSDSMRPDALNSMVPYYPVSSFPGDPSIGSCSI